MKKVSFSIIALGLLVANSLSAQIPGTNIPPRPDDHFQRNLVVNRIDLDEKINRPLVGTTDGSLYDVTRYPETNGIVAALINGVKSGKYLAYDPDNLTRTLTYEDVVNKAQSKDRQEDVEIDGEFPEDDPWIEDSEVIEDVDGSSTSGQSQGSGSAGTASVEGDFSIAPYETALEFIENRIIDKNRSSLIYDIQYIRLVWVDPAETLPDENFICLKFSDVLETLEATQWKNAYNDAEDRNMREILEERIFNSFVINVSGRGSRTLADAEYQRNKQLEFEHNLWSN